MRLFRRLFKALLIVVLAAYGGGPVFAALTNYDTETHDYLNLGAPKFVDVNYIDLAKIGTISKFRSNAGHDYSDSTQFSGVGTGYFDNGKPLETCRSMKHYFAGPGVAAPEASVNIYAPTNGVVSRMFDELIGGTQLQITSSDQPAFTFIIFHVTLATPLNVGDRVTVGQVLGRHVGPQTTSDIAVAVHTPRGYHLVSYFEVLTDKAFAAFQARGVTSREQMIYTRDQRDAAKFTCSGIRFTGDPNASIADYVALTGGAVSQTITANFSPIGNPQVGGAAVPISATASSGLPVSIVSRTPKVCAIIGGTVTWRRPGICTLVLSQDGNAGTYAALSQYLTHTVIRANETFANQQPRLGGIYPSSLTTVQSFLRIYNSGNGASVTLSLLDGGTGAVLAQWTSPTIPSRSSQQFPISVLEAAIPPGTARPQMYGLKVESGLFGNLQHVLFNPATGVLTNASSCYGGVTGNPAGLMNVHSRTLSGDFPSTLVLANADNQRRAMGVQFYDSNAGTALSIGLLYLTSPDGESPLGHSQVSVPVSTLEQRLNLTPSATAYHYVVGTYGVSPPYAYIQHLVSNVGQNIVSDMTTSCDLYGAVSQTIPAQLATPSIYSSLNATQSYLRFYNAGSAAGTVTVTLYDVDTGGSLGQWTSDPIAAGAAPQFNIGAIENAMPALARKQKYTLTVDTPLDGFFQHILWSSPSGALTNLSTCAGSVGTEPTVLMGVHSSSLGGGAYPSTVFVTNTGSSATSVQLGIYDAATGAKLGSHTTSAIAPNGQAILTAADLEKSATVGTATQYVLKIESTFTGFMQHHVASRAAGAVSDMTLVCAM